jgi:uncharacterized membrane protein YhaH (DUF805 family)
MAPMAPIPTYPAAPVQAPQLTYSKCPQCLRDLHPGAVRCPYCGTALASGKDYAGYAGGLIIATAAVNITLFAMAFAGSFLPGTAVDPPLQASMVVLTVLNILALLGGISALQRRRWKFAVLSAIICIVSLVFFLGIIALALLATSKAYFAAKAKKSYEL